MTSVVADVADVLEIPFTVGGGVRSLKTPSESSNPAPIACR